jgi:hypothetical protein
VVKRLEGQPIFSADPFRTIMAVDSGGDRDGAKEWRYVRRDRDEEEGENKRVS